MQNVLVINIRTNKKATSNNEGFFSIPANVSDELRFVKDNYERGSRKVFNEDLSNLISITLIQIPTEIEEVKLAFNPTGNINKDINFNSSKKIAKLNMDISEYVKKPMTEIRPKNSISSSFVPRDPYAGQLNLLSISIGGTSGGIIGLLLSEAIKKNKIKPSVSDIKNFHQKVKNSFYGDYYIKQGLKEYDFDAYIIYLDNKYKFSEKYFSNFDAIKIEIILKNSLKEFLK